MPIQIISTIRQNCEVLTETLMTNYILYSKSCLYKEICLSIPSRVAKTTFNSFEEGSKCMKLLATADILIDKLIKGLFSFDHVDYIYFLNTNDQINQYTNDLPYL